MSIREIPTFSPSATLDEIREALGQLLQWAKERDPQAIGEDTQKFISFESALSIGLVKRTSRGYVSGGGSFDDGGWVPDYPDGIDDNSPPTAASGLVVTSVRTGFFIEIDSPNYPQGGENAYTEVWGAKYSGTGPLPQFSDAVFIGQIQGKSGIYLVQAEPGVQQHFWVGTVTRAGIRQIDVQGPTGGLNGVYAVAGKIDDRHIESLSVAKLLTGEIQVGTTISSFGYTGTNTYEWQIDGNGVARFSGVIVRGTVYASAGEIGGASIHSNYVQSTTYDGSGNGWRLDNALGKIFAGKILISNVGATVVLDTEATGTDPILKMGSVLSILGNGDASLGTLDLAGALRSGQTAYDTGTGFWLGKVSGTPKFSIGDASHAMLWTGSALQLRGVEIDNFSASISGGDISFTQTVDSFGNMLNSWPTRTISVSGGRSPFKYQWMVVITQSINSSGATVSIPVILLGSTTTTVDIRGEYPDSTVSGHLGCIITDANGRVTYTKVSFTLNLANVNPGDVGSAE